MKNFKLAFLTVASLAVSTANAGIISYSGAIESWLVDTTGTYSITVEGAQGASGSSTFVGGRGASLTALFDLVAGSTYYFAVGGMGSSSANDSGSGGGGGGSFFVDALNNPLLVAGGGGGTRAEVSQNGCDASTTTFGIAGSGSSDTSSCTVKTTAEGLGGIISSSSWGSAGAGFFGNGAVEWGATAAESWLNGLAGGAGGCGGGAGGFGGGGSGAGCWGGGGGGGYSGGDGGRVAGGGGSFSAGTGTVALAGVGYGNGYASWDLVSSSVPEPGTLAMLGLGLVGMAAARRGRKTSAV